MEVFRLPRCHIGVGFPVKLPVYTRDQSPLRVKFRVWGWKYRPPLTIAESTAPSANLDIYFDGASKYTGLGDGTEKLLVDELIEYLDRPGSHEIEFKLTSGVADISAEVIYEY